MQLGVRMAETTAWVESGGGASPEIGVTAEGGAMMMDVGRDDELRGPSLEANGWAHVEAALNWMVSASWQEPILSSIFIYTRISLTQYHGLCYGIPITS